jgi:hypothetical protein
MKRVIECKTYSGCVLVVVTLAVKTNTDTVRDVLDSLSPDGGVEGGLEDDLLGTHVLLSESLDGLDGGRSTVLESLSVDASVEVDRVLAGDDVGKGRTGLALRGVLVSTGHC